MCFGLIDLGMFPATVETDSITRGAERSAMPLASASARLQGMEDALGLPSPLLSAWLALKPFV